MGLNHSSEDWCFACLFCAYLFRLGNIPSLWPTKPSRVTFLWECLRLHQGVLSWGLSFSGLFILGHEMFWSFWSFQGGKCSVIKVLGLALSIKEWGEVNFHGAPGKMANPFQERRLPFWGMVELSRELRYHSCLTLKEQTWCKGELPSCPAIWGGWLAVRLFNTQRPLQWFCLFPLTSFASTLHTVSFFCSSHPFTYPLLPTEGTFLSGRDLLARINDLLFQDPWEKMVVSCWFGLYLLTHWIQLSPLWAD